MVNPLQLGLGQSADLTNSRGIIQADSLRLNPPDKEKHLSLTDRKFFFVYITFFGRWLRFETRTYGVAPRQGRNFRGRSLHGDAAARFRREEALRDAPPNSDNIISKLKGRPAGKMFDKLRNEYYVLANIFDNHKHLHRGVSDELQKSFFILAACFCARTCSGEQLCQ
jgi:hypothetical protein